MLLGRIPIFAEMNFDYQSLAKKAPIIAVIMACLVLIAIKFNVLHLPHFWDEAFPYSYAIKHMTENGPSILSDGAPTILTTGHPLLYYYIQATWNGMVGDSMALQRTLPLILSVFLLVFTYLVGKSMFNKKVGAGATLLLLAQNIFLAQSAFQLPEVLMALLFLATIYYRIEKKNIGFIITSSLLLITKEPAVVLLGILFLYDFFILQKNSSFIKRISNSWWYFIPAIVMVGFYFHQYLVQGWVLFPRHVGFMKFEWSHYFNQLSRYFSFTFIFHGRNALFFLTLILGGIAITKRKTIEASKNSGNLFLIGVLFLYLIVSSVNFYSNRYILAMFPVFTLLASNLIFKLLKFKQLAPIAIIAFTFTGFFYSFKNKAAVDSSLGYVDSIACRQDALQYIQSKNWEEKSIFAGFIFEKSISHYAPGYLKAGEEFTNVNKRPFDVSDVAIVIDKDIDEKAIRESNLFQLIQTFENGNSYCNIYIKK